jgi:hypothetical protein
MNCLNLRYLIRENGFFLGLVWWAINFAEQLEAAASRTDFVSAKVYQLGKIVEMSDRKYRVGHAGNLIRIK